jgi:antitoxin component YwqK of YwqJK toxin-antitoxin module
MKTFDNNGKLISEINNSLTSDGKAINSQTTYNNGRPVTQVISVRDRQGKVSTTTVINGKIIP